MQPQGWVSLLLASCFAFIPNESRAATRAEDDSEAEEVDAETEDEAPKKKKKKRSKKKRKKFHGPPSGMAKRIGFGAARTLSGLNALAIRGYASDRISFGGHLGLASFTHRDVGRNGEFDDVNFFGRAGAGLEFLAWPVTAPRSKVVYADVGIGARTQFFFGFTGSNDNDSGNRTLNDPFEIDIEVPVVFAIFLGDNVSLQPEFGAVIRLIPGKREADQNGDADANPGTGIGSALGTSDGPGIGFEFGDHAGLFFGLSLLYHFGS